MWHASVAGYSPQECRTQAIFALDGVGDPHAGQWEENGFAQGGTAYHVRRRLTKKEAAQVGPVVDIRSDAAEVARRLAPVKHLLPPDYHE